MDKIIQTGSHIEKGSYQNLIASFQFFVKVWITIIVLVLIDSLPPEQTVPSRSQTGSHIEKGSYQNLIASFQFFVKVWITIIVLVLIDSLPPEQTVPSRRKPPCHSQPGLGWSSHHRRQSA